MRIFLAISDTAVGKLEDMSTVAKGVNSFPLTDREIWASHSTSLCALAASFVEQGKDLTSQLGLNAHKTARCTHSRSSHKDD